MTPSRLTPVQQLFLARLERLLALPAACHEPVAAGLPELVAWAIRSIFDDCLETGVGFEASLRLDAWLRLAAQRTRVRPLSRQGGDDDAD